jgi:hypothetical protein
MSGFAVLSLGDLAKFEPAKFLIVEELADLADADGKPLKLVEWGVAAAELPGDGLFF